MLLGVLSACGPAEIIPYEPEMYNDSAGKRYYFSIMICIHCRIPSQGVRLIFFDNCYGIQKF